MTTEQWFNGIDSDRKQIESIIKNYHPYYRDSVCSSGMQITAPNAEIAARNVRVLVKQQTKADPLSEFDRAFIERNVSLMMTVMNGAWFGVPESTSCWDIEGFKEIVRYLEDPPEDDNVQE